MASADRQGWSGPQTLGFGGTSVLWPPAQVWHGQAPLAARVHPDQQQCDPQELRGSPAACPSLGRGKVINAGWSPAGRCGPSPTASCCRGQLGQAELTTAG